VQEGADRGASRNGAAISERALKAVIRIASIAIPKGTVYAAACKLTVAGELLPAAIALDIQEDVMRTSRLLLVLAPIFVAGAAYADRVFNHVDPFEFDPADTRLVQATWLPGIGCPTNARISPNGTDTTPFTDTACPTGDSRDRQNQGLLLVKTGPTANDASAGARLKNVPSTVTELGYDIRKPASVDPRGSHCGAGAPRFNIETRDGHIFFIGCNSPPATTQTSSATGWTRLRWGAATVAFGQLGGVATLGSLNVKAIEIIFDEGQDASGAPDQFGAAVLDNIDVNGKLVGQGPTEPGIQNGGGDDKDDDD
jgi:hypothetical protein